MWLPLAATAPVALVVTAAADATSGAPDLYSLLLQAPAAAICVLFMLDKIHGPGMKKDRDEARKQLADLNKKVIDDVVPALTRANDTVERERRRHERGDG